MFNKYVKSLYAIKSTTNDLTEKAVSKSLLNNLLGRFGMSINKPITEIVDNNKLELICCTRKVNSYKTITDDDYLITYYPDISQEICESYGFDYFKTITKYNHKLEYNKEFNDVSLTTAAAITSYAIIYMSTVKLDILSKNGNMFYTDTDSLVVDIPLSDNLIGSDLGKFKLECRVKLGYFISSKTYALQLQDDTIIIKAKGVTKNCLTLDDFKSMYHGNNIKAIKNNTTTDLEKGSVVIGTSNVTLDHNSYKKREKIYLQGN